MWAKKEMFVHSSCYIVIVTYNYLSHYINLNGKYI